MSVMRLLQCLRLRLRGLQRLFLRLLLILGLALPGWAATVNSAMNWVGFDLADLPREVLVDLVGEQAATDYTIGNALCVAPS